MQQATVTKLDQSVSQALVSQWLRDLRSLAQQAGCEPTVEDARSKAARLGSPTIHLAIIGSPNSGKTSLLNGLIGRNLLPVSSIPSHVAFDLNGEASPSGEQFLVAGSPRPISQLPSVKSANGSPIVVTLNIDCEWIRSASLQICEKPALDADEEHTAEVVDALLRDVDIVVLVIDSLTPVRRTEAVLLAECTRKGLPMIVALSKLDKLEEDERHSVLAYVEKQVRQKTPSAQIVEAGTVRVKEGIISARNSTDFASLRLEQVKETLRASINMVIATTKAKTDVAAKKNQQLEEEQTDGRNKIEAKNLAWLEIEQQLGQRREKVEAAIRAHLSANEQAVLDDLTHDLEKSSDVKIWWERDLSYLMERGLKKESLSIERTVQQELARDGRWLQGKLHAEFGLPLAIGPETTVKMTEPNIEATEIPLGDAQKFKIVSRIGTAAAVLAAGTLFVTASIPGAVLATSLIAGLGAEQWIKHTTSQNKDRVRAELKGLVGRASLGYSSEISAKLAIYYNALISSLRDEQARWHESQLEGLTARSKDTNTSDLDNLNEVLNRAVALAAEIASPATAH